MDGIYLDLLDTFLNIIFQEIDHCGDVGPYDDDGETK